MKVNFHKLDDAGRDIVIGSLTWNGRLFEVDPPDNRVLRSILTDDIGVIVDGKEKVLTSSANPEEWLSNLHRHFRSAYLRATKLIDE